MTTQPPPQEESLKAKCYGTWDERTAIIDALRAEVAALKAERDAVREALSAILSETIAGRGTWLEIVARIQYLAQTALSQPRPAEGEGE